MAAHGSVNANTKWQYQCNEKMHFLTLKLISILPQLSYNKIQGQLVLPVEKIVDDLVTREPLHVNSYPAKLNNYFRLGTIARGPGQFRFSGPQILQHDDMTWVINNNRKLQALERYRLSRSWRAGQKRAKYSWKSWVDVITFVDWMACRYGITMSHILC